MKLVRRVSFSAGHRYWRANLTPDQNRKLFGPWASPFSHGHNFVLDVTTEGELDEASGMVVNIKRIDDVLQESIVARLNQRSLNDEIPEFRELAPCLENLLLVIPSWLADLPQEARLTHLRLQEMPDFWADYDLTHNDMTLTRTYEFAASHRLHNPSLSHEENLEIYGKCNNPAGHGHNYILAVTVGGDPDPRTGFLCDLGALDEAVGRLVDRYDHRSLDVDVPELRGKITTSEVVLQAIWNQLDGNLPAPLKRLRLEETARSAFEIER